MTKKQDDTQVRVSKHGSMFTLVKKEDKKVAICAGGYQICEKEFDSFEQAEEHIGRKPYDLIFNVVSLLIYKNNESQKNEATNKES